MEFTSDTTNRGFAVIAFKDRYKQACSIQESSLAEDTAIWFGVDVNVLGDAVNNRMHLTQPMVEALLPILHGFVLTGQVRATAKHPTGRFLDLSTAHLNLDAKRWLGDQAALNTASGGSGSKISTLGETRNGWFMHAPGDPRAYGYEMPEELAAIIDRARAEGCSYILFDSDADEIDGLPTWDDAGNRIVPEPAPQTPLKRLVPRFEDSEDAGLADELAEQGSLGADAGLALPPLPSEADHAMFRAQLETMGMSSDVIGSIIANIAAENAVPPDSPWQPKPDRPYVIPAETPIRYTQSGKSKLDTLGHAVVDKRALNELLDAGAAAVERFQKAIDAFRRG